MIYMKLKRPQVVKTILRGKNTAVSIIMSDRKGIWRWHKRDRPKKQNRGSGSKLTKL